MKKAIVYSCIIGCIAVSLTIVSFYELWSKDISSIPNRPALSVDQDMEYGYYSWKPPKPDMIDISSYHPKRQDWVITDKTLLISHFPIQSEFEKAIDSFKKEYYVAPWYADYTLSMLNYAYLTSHDESYLSMFIQLYDLLLTKRSDSMAARFYDGTIRPQWFSPLKYTISEFNIENRKLTDEEIDELRNKRGWINLNFANVSHNGLIINQALRFAQIIKANKVYAMSPKASKIIEDCKSVIDSWDTAWKQIAESEGFYIFPNNSPYRFDGIEVPINEAAHFASAIVRLYMLTGDHKYLQRAKSIWNHWLNAMRYDQYEYIVYPYVTGELFNGWNQDSSVSSNTPMEAPRRMPETFHKAASTLQFILLLSQYDDGIDPYIKEFYRVFLATQQCRHMPNGTPNMLGFLWQETGCWDPLPYQWSGWNQLVACDRESLNYAYFVLPYIEPTTDRIVPIMSLMYYSEVQPPYYRIRQKLRVHKGSEPARCELPKDAEAYVELHTLAEIPLKSVIVSVKNVGEDKNYKIRMLDKDGTLYAAGFFAVPGATLEFSLSQDSTIESIDILATIHLRFQ